jgi:uncharacterized membrane protein
MNIKPLLPPITGFTFGLLSEILVREIFENVTGVGGPAPALWALLVGTLVVLVVGVVQRWGWVEGLMSLGTVLLGAIIGFIIVFSQTAA